MKISLDGRTAMITGGSKGLGLGMARAFHDAGASVAILARGAEGLDAARREIGGADAERVLALPCDVLEADDLAEAYRRTVAAFGKVDIVVSNAGGSRAGRFLEADDAGWYEDFDLKIMSAVRLIRLAVPGMLERRWGRIINVLSTTAKVPGKGSPLVATTRAAGIGLTKSLANEFAPHNVLVNAMVVGLVKSDQHEKRARAAGRSIDEAYREMAAGIPAGRVGESAEFAAMALFLASDAGSYVTGTAINVDGGLSPVT